jgi:hypothetical protein
VAKDVKGHCEFSTTRRDTGYIAGVKRKPRLGKKNPLARSWVNRKFRPGYRGYPIATVAFYGPDDKLATKVVVSLFLTESNEPDFLGRWYSESDIDVRQDLDIGEQILGFLKPHAPRSTVLTQGIIGCPHEEGVDYPEGTSCQQCPYWAGRDRFTHERIQ